jgi:hypothetical protein
MNKTFSNIPKVMIVLTVIFFLSNGFAMDIPRQINYQGKLMENGIPVNGIKTITFSIMDMDMNPLWTETHENVLIKNGL